MFRAQVEPHHLFHQLAVSPRALVSQAYTLRPLCWAAAKSVCSRRAVYQCLSMAGVGAAVSEASSMYCCLCTTVTTILLEAFKGVRLPWKS